MLRSLSNDSQKPKRTSHEQVKHMVRPDEITKDDEMTSKLSGGHPLHCEKTWITGFFPQVMTG